jgi:TPR repeat protein
MQQFICHISDTLHAVGFEAVAVAGLVAAMGVVIASFWRDVDKKVCGGEGGSGARGDAAAASGVDDAPLQHPCPICLDNEDDAVGFGMCFSCGQMYCGKCNVDGGILDTCPTCRAVLNVSGQENVRRLLVLLERPCGRSTPITLCNLGTCYESGTGVDQDYTEAVRLYRLAADQGNAHAQCNLGACYKDGTGVDQDHAETIRLYRLAADQGYPYAQHYLGCCYAHGTGVVQDHAEAVRWFRLAADQGFANALRSLWTCYWNGTGVDQDRVEAVRLMRLATNQGDANVQANLAMCYRSGTGGVDQDQAEAVRLWRLAADQGHANAQCNLGSGYAYGIGVDQDRVEAARLWRLAANQGVAAARQNLRREGFALEGGLFVSW